MYQNLSRLPQYLITHIPERIRLKTALCVFRIHSALDAQIIKPLTIPEITHRMAILLVHPLNKIKIVIHAISSIKTSLQIPIMILSSNIKHTSALIHRFFSTSDDFLRIKSVSTET